MRTLFLAKTFVRAHKRAVKKNPSLRGDIEATLRLLKESPFAPQLGTHKLHGPFAGSWGCSAGYDLRVVFDFVRSEGKGEDDIILDHNRDARRSVLTNSEDASGAYDIAFGGLQPPVEGTMDWGVFRH